MKSAGLLSKAMTLYENQTGPKVKFEDAWTPPATPLDSRAPKLVQRMIDHSGGLIKTEEQASVVLLVFVALAVIISLYFIFAGDDALNMELPPDAEVIYSEHGPPRLNKPIVPINY